MTRELKENRWNIFILAIQPNTVAMVIWCVQEEWGSLYTTPFSASWLKTSIARSGTPCWGRIRSNYEPLWTLLCAKTQTLNMALPLEPARAASVKRRGGCYLGRQMRANKCLIQMLHGSQLWLSFLWITLQNRCRPDVVVVVVYISGLADTYMPTVVCVVCGKWMGGNCSVAEKCYISADCYQHTQFFFLSIVAYEV